MSIRPMRLRDVDAVLAMLKTSFDPALVRYLTHTQSGARALLGSYLTQHYLVPSVVLMVLAERDDDPVGFAEFSQEGDSAHLSYVCVAEQSRGRGVATALIESFVEAQQPGSLSLDVFTDNAPALKLYEKQGFEVQEEQVWSRRPLPGASTPLALTSPLDSIAMHTLFGFCNLRTTYEGTQATLGWIGADVVRCYDTIAFRDDALLSSVRATLPAATEAFVIAPPAERGSVAVPGASILTRSLRLQRSYAGHGGSREGRA